MNSFLKKTILLLFTFMPLLLNAQEVEMADKFRSDGKIYVVIAVLFVVLAGIFTYLILLDRKVKSLEEKVKSKK